MLENLEIAGSGTQDAPVSVCFRPQAVIGHAKKHRGKSGFSITALNLLSDFPPPHPSNTGKADGQQ